MKQKNSKDAGSQTVNKDIKTKDGGELLEASKALLESINDVVQEETFTCSVCGNQPNCPHLDFHGRPLSKCPPEVREDHGRY